MPAVVMLVGAVGGCCNVAFGFVKAYAMRTELMPVRGTRYVACAVCMFMHAVCDTGYAMDVYAGAGAVPGYARACGRLRTRGCARGLRLLAIARADARARARACMRARFALRRGYGHARG